MEWSEVVQIGLMWESRLLRAHYEVGPGILPGFVTRAAKGGQMLSFSWIGRRRHSLATSRSTIREKRDRWVPFGARSRNSVKSPG